MPASESQPRSNPVTVLQVTHRGGGLLIGHFGHVCIAVWSTKPTWTLFAQQSAGLANVVQHHPGRALFMCVVSSKADPPEQDVRDASAKMIINHGRQLAGCACVIEGSGFRAAITRTVLTGISLLVRTPAPFGFCDSVNAGYEWLGRYSPRGSLTGLPEELARARADERDA